MGHFYRQVDYALIQYHHRIDRPAEIILPLTPEMECYTVLTLQFFREAVMHLDSV
jgi:hypothetical protein